MKNLSKEMLDEYEKEAQDDEEIDTEAEPEIEEDEPEIETESEPEIEEDDEDIEEMARELGARKRRSNKKTTKKKKE